MKRSTTNKHRGALLLLIAIVWAWTAAGTLPVFAQKTPSKNDAPAFVLDISKRLGKRNQALYDSIVKRESTADVRLAQLQPSRFLLVNSRISIDLFQGGSVVATRKAITVINDNSFTWHGVSEKGADVLITVYNGEYSATIIREDKFTYSIESLGDDTYAFVKNDAEKEPKIQGCGNPRADIRISGQVESAHTHDMDMMKNKSGTISNNTECNPTRIDILVAYTPAFTNSGRTISDIYNANAVANAALQASGVSLAYNIVHVMGINYTEAPGTSNAPGIHIDLANFAANSSVAMARDQYRADICILASGMGNGNAPFLGLAYRGPSNSFAYAVVNTNGFLSSKFSNAAYAHEIGHIMGADHPPSDPSSNPYRPYGRGYTGNGIKTIMATDADQGSLVLRFSAPPNYGDYGINEVARALNEDGPTVGSFRASLSSSISGTNNLNVGQRGTWTASVCGGSGSSYTWYIRSNDPMSNGWYQVGSNSSTYSTTMRNYDQFIQLRVDITTTSGETTTAYTFVSCNNCGSGGAQSLASDILLPAQTITEQTRFQSRDSIATVTKVYPNPAEDFMTVSYMLHTDGDVECQIVDVHKRIINQKRIGYQAFGNNEVVFNTSSLSPGTYIVRLIVKGTIIETTFRIVR